MCKQTEFVKHYHLGLILEFEKKNWKSSTKLTSNWQNQINWEENAVKFEKGVSSVRIFFFYRQIDIERSLSMEFNSIAPNA